MGAPVVVVNSGGLPVTEAANGFGTPIEVAGNGFGIPITYVASGGLPVVSGGGVAPPAPVYAKLAMNAIFGSLGDSIPATAWGASGLITTSYWIMAWLSLLTGGAFRLPPEYQQASPGVDSAYMRNVGMPALQALARFGALVISETNSIGTMTFAQAKANWDAIIAGMLPRCDTIIIIKVGEGSYWTPDQLIFAKALNDLFRSYAAAYPNQIIVAEQGIDDPSNLWDGNHNNQKGGFTLASNVIAGGNIYLPSYDVIGDFTARKIRTWDITNPLNEWSGSWDGYRGGTAEGTFPDGISVYPPTGIHVIGSKDTDNSFLLQFSGTYTGDLSEAQTLIEVYDDNVTTIDGSSSEALWKYTPTDVGGSRSFGLNDSWYVGEDLSTNAGVFVPPDDTMDTNTYNGVTYQSVNTPYLERCPPVTQPAGGDTRAIDGVVYHQVGIAQTTRIKIHGIYLASLR